MIDFKIRMEHPEDWDNQAENYIESGEICLYLENMKVRKNINMIRLARRINYFYICEFLCLYGQIHQKGFIDKCDGGNKQSNCPIDWVLAQANISR